MSKQAVGCWRVLLVALVLIPVALSYELGMRTGPKNHTQRTDIRLEMDPDENYRFVEIPFVFLGSHTAS